MLLMIVMILGMLRGSDGVSNFKDFIDSGPNEIGDTLAGIFSSLAFIWIVVTVFLQRDELTAQRRELSLTREELALTRAAHEKQVEGLIIQTQMLIDEKGQRDQNRAFEEVEELVRELDRTCFLEAMLECRWEFEKEIGSGDTSRHVVKLIKFSQKASDYLRARKFAVELREANKAVLDRLTEGWRIKVGPDLNFELHSIRKICEKIDSLAPLLSNARRIRTQSYRLDDLLEAVQEVEDHPSYWSVWARGSKGLHQ